jgi:hypothetical protein
VTVGQFEQFVRESGYKTDAERDGNGRTLEADTGDLVLKRESIGRTLDFLNSIGTLFVDVSWNERERVLRLAGQEGWQILPPPHRSRMGVRLPRRNDLLFF